MRTRKLRGGTFTDLSEAEQLFYDGGRATESHLLLSQILAALAKLPDQQRHVVPLVLIDGVSYAEAASVLEVPVGTVTSRLARARDALSLHVFGVPAATELLQ